MFHIPDPAAFVNLAGFMEEIMAASQEQSQGIDEVSRTVTQLDDMTQQNAALSKKLPRQPRPWKSRRIGWKR